MEYKYKTEEVEIDGVKHILKDGNYVPYIEEIKEINGIKYVKKEDSWVPFEEEPKGVNMEVLTQLAQMKADMKKGFEVFGEAIAKTGTIVETPGQETPASVEQPSEEKIEGEALIFKTDEDRFRHLYEMNIV